jgi:hypothetical protein
MNTIHILLLSTIFGVVSCNKSQTSANAKYRSKSEVLESENKERGEVFFVEGAPGPYKFGSRSYGHAGSENRHRSFNVGGASFDFPQDSRFTYEATSYINKNGYALIVARRLPIPTDSKNSTEQDGTSNGG